MGRIQQPRELAELKGATKHDPQRYKTTPPKNKFALGCPPEMMGESAKAAWFELETYALPGVLTASERFLMELAANLLVEYRCDPSSFMANKMGHLISILGRLGLSPADRQKLGMAEKPKDNPFNDF